MSRRRTRASPRGYADNVFINCPYDRRYETLFDAIVFTVYDCGFLPRCALEVDDAAKDRVEKIIHLIRDCKYAISDLSRIESDPRSKLPRFNMPFELGLVLGLEDCERRHRRRQKVALILEQRAGQYRRFISDLAGREAKAHGDKARKAVTIVRDWLKTAAKGVVIPSGDHIWRRYKRFEKELPGICQDLHLSPRKLIYADYVLLVEEWVTENPF